MNTELINTIKLGNTEEAIRLLEVAADVYQDNDAVLREAVFQRDKKLINTLIEKKYPQESDLDRARSHIENDMDELKKIFEGMPAQRERILAAAKLREAGVEIQIGE